MSTNEMAVFAIGGTVVLSLIFGAMIGSWRGRYIERELSLERDKRIDLRTAINTLEYWFRDNIQSNQKFQALPTSDGLKRWHKFCLDTIDRDQRHIRERDASRSVTVSTKHGIATIRMTTRDGGSLSALTSREEEVEHVLVEAGTKITSIMESVSPDTRKAVAKT